MIRRRLLRLGRLIYIRLDLTRIYDLLCVY